jgi:hypothetical protein
MRKHLTYANVMATIAVFGVLGGGAAYAANTIGSSDIINGQVKSVDIGTNQVESADVRDDTLSGGGLGAADLGPHSVRSNEVANDSLTGTDIAESSLGEVPSAALGGLGGESPLANSCDPDAADGFITCAHTGTITLAAPTRVLIIGQIRADPEVGGGDGLGECRVGTNAGFLPESEALASVKAQPDVMTMSGITGVVGPGPIAFGLDCDELAGQPIKYVQAHLTFVELSPG